MKREDFENSLKMYKEVFDEELEGTVAKWISCSEQSPLGMTMCTEECAELIMSLSKYLRYGLTDNIKFDILEEIADVSLSIDYICDRLSVSKSEFNKAKNIKAERAITIRTGDSHDKIDKC